MTGDGFRPARLDRLARILVRDSTRWAAAIVKRMGSRDPALLGRLTSEAAAFATCLLQTRMDPDHRNPDLEQEVVRAMQSAWTASSARHGFVRSDPVFLNSVSAPSSDKKDPGAMVSTLELHRHPSADAQQAAREFQQATGLGAQALVGKGPNLAALIFYHRIFLAARQSSDFDASHRAEIVRAAQQVRERFERTLKRQATRECGASTHLGDGQGIWDPLPPCPADLPTVGQ